MFSFYTIFLVVWNLIKVLSMSNRRLYDASISSTSSSFAAAENYSPIVCREYYQMQPSFHSWDVIFGYQAITRPLQRQGRCSSDLSPARIATACIPGRCNNTTIAKSRFRQPPLRPRCARDGPRGASAPAAGLTSR